MREELKGYAVNALVVLVASMAGTSLVAGRRPPEGFQPGGAQGFQPGGAQGPAQGFQPGGMQASSGLQDKARRLQEQLPKYVAAGGDPSRLGPLMQKMDGSMRAGRIQEAEDAADELLALVAKGRGN